MTLNVGRIFNFYKLQFVVSAKKCEPTEGPSNQTSLPLLTWHSDL